MNQVSRLSLHSINLKFSKLEPTTSIESNSLQIQREKINQLVKENYRVVISNVDQLDEAQIICLGESHNNEIHKEINAQIVDTLYEDESILLVEETSQENNEQSKILYENEILPEQAKYVKKAIKIQGWDIEFDENRRKELHEFVKASTIYKKPKVSDFLTLSKITKVDKDLENNELSNCCQITKIFSFFCTWCCTAIFIKSCTPCIKKYYKNKAYQGLQEIINEVPIRNQKMCETIQHVLETHKKVFIIAGNKHFDFVEEGEGIKELDFGPSNKAIGQTIDFLATKKFVILIPKS